MMEEEQYNLISTHTSLAAFFTRVAVKGMKKRPPVACMVHGYLFDEETPWLKQAVLLTAEKWMASVTDLLLTMNEWDYAWRRSTDWAHVLSRFQAWEWISPGWMPARS